MIGEGKVGDSRALRGRERDDTNVSSRRRLMDGWLDVTLKMQTSRPVPVHATFRLNSPTLHSSMNAVHSKSACVTLKVIGTRKQLKGRA